MWRREGLKVPARKPRRGRLWLNDGSCVRLRPERRNHVWACDFVQARTRDGRAVRLLTATQTYTRECLTIRAGRGIRSPDVIGALGELMTARGVPWHIRSGNGPEFTARAVRGWLGTRMGKVPVRMTARGWHIRSGNGLTARAVRGWLGTRMGKVPVHRAWITVGERIRGELQRQAEGRTAGPGSSTRCWKCGC